MTLKERYEKLHDGVIYGVPHRRGDEPILIIGSGPSLLDRERGAEIDDFKGKIVRCSNYKIKKYEKYVGTRTDILIISHLKLDKVLELQYEDVLLYLTHNDGGNILRKAQKMSVHNKINFVPLIVKDKLKDAMNLENYPEPTVGMMALYWFMEKKLNIYFCGMDCTPGIDYYNNVYHGTDQASACHDYEKEKLYIEFLIEKQKIKRF